LKVLGEGELTKKLTVAAEKFSASAKAKIEAAGGSVTELPMTKWTREAAAAAGGGAKASKKSKTADGSKK